MGCNQSARVGEIAPVVYGVEATIPCWMYNGRSAIHRRGPVIDVMYRPTLVSPNRSCATSSKKSHDGWAIISRVGLLYACLEQASRYIYRVLMMSDSSRASWPKQFADLWPLKKTTRFCADRKDRRPFHVRTLVWGSECLKPLGPRLLVEKVEAVSHSWLQDSWDRRCLRSIILQPRAEWLSKPV